MSKTQDDFLQSDRFSHRACLLHAEGGPAVVVPPVMPEQRRQHRLEAWVDRELRALLQTDDVAIVRAYVMGLVRGIGFVGQQVCCNHGDCSRG